MTSAGHGPPGPSTPTSVSAPLWRRVFQGGRERLPPRINNFPSTCPPYLPAASSDTNKPSGLEVAHDRSSSQTTPITIHPGPNEDHISPEQKPEPPQWSVVYNPEVERALDLQLAHSFTYDSEAYCVKMSPDGQRLAVGLAYDGTTYINESKTGSNIWQVSQPLDGFGFT